MLLYYSFWHQTQSGWLRWIEINGLVKNALIVFSVGTYSEFRQTFLSQDQSCKRHLSLMKSCNSCICYTNWTCELQKNSRFALKITLTYSLHRLSMPNKIPFLPYKTLDIFVIYCPYRHSILQGHPCPALGAGRILVSNNQLVHKTNSLFLQHPNLQNSLVSNMAYLTQ